ncbi:MAG: SPOR domain-containing protein [Proteobacteria bacterium]|nr:SPOR domain-containing protein [Pseudomonadota bacterium]
MSGVRMRGFTWWIAVVLSVAISAPCMAQGATDAAFQRARQLVNAGNGAAGRAVVDSVLRSTPEGSPTYGEALYWRARFAESAEQARLDYLRITIDYPLHARAADALLRLAQLEFARGDRAAARRYLDQLALEHGDGPTAAQGAFWLGRVLLEDGAVLDACAALAHAKEKTRAEDVELQGQITYYMQPCARARADSIARADSVSRALADSLRADSVAHAKKPPKGTAKPEGKSGKGAKGAVVNGPAWSAQVAAYAQQDDAERLAKKLRARGYEARVTADAPYRVRVGRFTKRAGAVGLVEKLRAAKMTAIVVEAERP